MENNGMPHLSDDIHTLKCRFLAYFLKNEMAVSNGVIVLESAGNERDKPVVNYSTNLKVNLFTHHNVTQFTIPLLPLFLVN